MGMSGRLRFEAWTLPTSATFQKICDVEGLPGSTGTPELSAATDGTLYVPADWGDLGLIVSDTSGSLIRVYDGLTLVDEFIAERVDEDIDRPGQAQVSGPNINALMEKLAVFPYDYPNDGEQQDWVWLGRTALPGLGLADLGSVREVWELWNDGTGGDYTLTVDGQTTPAIPHNIVSPLVIENRLQSLSSVVDVTVTGRGEGVRAIFELYNGASGGSQGLEVDGDLATWAYNAAAATVTTAIEGLAGVTDVGVTGAGTLASPWVITWHVPNDPSLAKNDTALTGGTSTLTETTAGEADPFIITFYNPFNPTTFTITDSVTGGSAELTLAQAGELDPAPITQSQRADARSDPDLHGEYADPPIEVETTIVNAPSEWSLKVNATSQFGGSQILLNVKEGFTYSNVEVDVRPVAAGDYRVVIRDIYENLIAASAFTVPLTAGTFQPLTIPEAFTIPMGVHQVIMRVAVVGPTYGTHYVDWEGATFNEGTPAATPTGIIRTLIENGQNERGAFLFLDLSSFTDLLDSAGDTLPAPISYTANFGQNLFQVLDDLNNLGYEWTVVAKTTPIGALTHDLMMYTIGGGGTDQTATPGGPAVQTGPGVLAANIVKRIPRFTAAVGWGAGKLYVEDTDATLETNFGRWERIFDVEELADTATIQARLTQAYAEQASNATATQATVSGDNPTVPLVAYRPGDKIWWQFPGILPNQARRIRKISWVHAAIDNELAQYTLHASKVHTDASAMSAALDHLLSRFERRRGGDLGASAGYVPPSPSKGPTIVVAGADAQPVVKSFADYVLNGDYSDKGRLHAALQQSSSEGSNDVLLIGTANIKLEAGFPTGVNVPFDVVFRGMGPGGYSQLLFTGEDAAETAVVINSGRGGIRDMQLHRNGTATVDMNIVTLNAGGFARNLWITGTWQGDGVVAFGNNFLIENVDVANLGAGFNRGFFTSGPTKGRIRDCSAIGCDVAGVSINGSADILVENFVGSSNAVDVLVPSSGAADIVISNLQSAAATSWAVDVQNAQRVSVLGGSLDTPANGIRYAAGAIQGIVSGVSMRQFSSGVGVEATGTGTRLLIDSNSFKGFTTAINVADNAHAIIGDNDFDTVGTEVATGTGGTVAGLATKNTITFTAPGTLSVSSGTLRYPITSAMTIVAVRVMVDTAPTGAAAIFDVNLNGTTIFTTPANRPTVAVSAFDSGNTVPDVVALAAGDYLQIDVDQIGSTIAGADAVLVIEVRA